jgi:hypothetical protein
VRSACRRRRNTVPRAVFLPVIPRHILCRFQACAPPLRHDIPASTILPAHLCMGSEPSPSINAESQRSCARRSSVMLTAIPAKARARWRVDVMSSATLNASSNWLSAASAQRHHHRLLVWVRPDGDIDVAFRHFGDSNRPCQGSLFRRVDLLNTDGLRGFECSFHSTCGSKYQGNPGPEPPEVGGGEPEPPVAACSRCRKILETNAD